MEPQDSEDTTKQGALDEKRRLHIKPESHNTSRRSELVSSLITTLAALVSALTSSILLDNVFRDISSRLVIPGTILAPLLVVVTSVVAVSTLFAVGFLVAKRNVATKRRLEELVREKEALFFYHVSNSVDRVTGEEGSHETNR